MNGQPFELPPGATVVDVLKALGSARSGVAVALNGEVVPKGSWPTEPVRAGDSIEVLTAAQGG